MPLATHHHNESVRSPALSNEPRSNIEPLFVSILFQRWVGVGVGVGAGVGVGWWRHIDTVSRQIAWQIYFKFYLVPVLSADLRFGHEPMVDHTLLAVLNDSGARGPGGLWSGDVGKPWG